MLNKGFFFSCIVLLASFIVLIANHENTQKIVFVNMKTAIDTPILILAKENISKSDKEKILDAYTKALPHVISQYGISNNVDIVSSAVLYGGHSVDITNEIILKTINKVMHNA